MAVRVPVEPVGWEFAYEQEQVGDLWCVHRYETHMNSGYSLVCPRGSRLPDCVFAADDPWGRVIWPDACVDEPVAGDRCSDLVWEVRRTRESARTL